MQMQMRTQMRKRVQACMRVRMRMGTLTAGMRMRMGTRTAGTRVTSPASARAG